MAPGGVPPLQIRTQGPVVNATHQEMAELRAEFDEFRCVKLRGLVSPDLLDLVIGWLRTEDFSDMVHGGVAFELTTMQSIGVHTLQLLLNHIVVRSTMEAITGIAPLRYFGGRIYRLVPGSGHRADWHDDVADGRQIGLSVNLNTEPFSGGCFEIRRRATRQIIRPMPNHTLGDAIVFRIDRDLEHRVSPIEGQRAKTAFAGWYHDTAGFTEMLRAAAFRT